MGPVEGKNALKVALALKESASKHEVLNRRSHLTRAILQKNLRIVAVSVNPENNRYHMKKKPVGMKGIAVRGGYLSNVALAEAFVGLHAREDDRWGACNTFFFSAIS